MQEWWSKTKVPAPVEEGQEQEKMVSCLGKSEIHISKAEIILLVH